MYIAVTREKQDSHNFIKNANFLPHRFINTPLIKVKNIFQKKNLQHIINADCLTFTSSNAIKILAEIDHNNEIIPKIKHKTIFAIGDVSAKAAQKTGFLNIIKANGNVEEMLKLIEKFCKNNFGKNIAYLSGKQISINLQREIQKTGAYCQRFILYEAQEVENLTEQLLKIIENEKLAAAVIFSPRTAQIWKSKIKLANMEKNVKNITYFCLSDKIAETLKEFECKQIKITKYKDADDMIKLLAKHFDDIK